MKTEANDRTPKSADVDRPMKETPQAQAQREAPPPTDSEQPRDGIGRSIIQESVCLLTFDRPGSSANLFDRPTLVELDQHLDYIENHSEIEGLILISGKENIFVAGADLKSLSQGTDPEGLRQMIELGQSVFNRLASLHIPTIAAIHGACVGGGYELSLACDGRIASTDRVTKIGLPETQLGLLPAWGGSTRLPRLIGLTRALDLILRGKTLSAQQAARLGMVDETVPRQRLQAAALNTLNRLRSQDPSRRGRTLSRSRRSLEFVSAPFIRTVLRRKLRRQTHDHYPAVLKALNVITKGYTRSFTESLKLERDAIEALVRTDACQNLIRAFFLQERSRKLAPVLPEQMESKPASLEKLPRVRQAAVIGAGVMGAGIAQWLSSRRLPVVLQDINSEQIAAGMTRIHDLFEQGVKRRRFSRLEARDGLDRIYPSAGESSLRQTDLVIEAVVEKMAVKKELFQRLVNQTSESTLLATNTSALSVSEIAAGTTAPHRVVGIHFFNPVHRMQLVEVVAGHQTAPETAARAVQFVQQIGKLPVLVQDSPGFLVNRILMPYLLEATRLLEDGADLKSIDRAMVEFGMPMGPLRLLDEVGLDVAHHVAETLAGHFQPRLTMPRILPELLESGASGRKGGAGFYLYRGRRTKVNPKVLTCRQNSSASTLSLETLQSRLVLLMINEAAMCLEESVVRESADVDFGMVMGTGFAPFRGGPLRYADALGLGKIRDAMTRFARETGPRYEPCRLVRQLAETEKTFYQNGGNR